MGSIKDDRGFNQMFQPSVSMDIRTERRCDMILLQIDSGAFTRIDTQKYNVLEIGCGTGELAFYLASKLKDVAHVTGSDICMPFIEEAKKRHQLPNLDFIVLDFKHPEKLNYRKFDYIVGNGILHHLYNNLDEALKNIRELLEPGGKMIFWEPNLLNPYCTLIFNTTKGMRKWANLEEEEMAFHKRKLTKKIKDAGFLNVHVEYKDFLLPNTPERLIKPVIAIGDRLERIPFLRWLSQSLFIVGTKK